MSEAVLDRPAAAAERRPTRILVVDDERSMRELLAIVLKREGYEVLLAENGRTALETLAREAIDLLITDIKMPDMKIDAKPAPVLSELPRAEMPAPQMPAPLADQRQ